MSKKVVLFQIPKKFEENWGYLMLVEIDFTTIANIASA
jgi:hypothetical protein